MIDTMATCPKCEGTDPDCGLCLGGGEVQISSLFDFVIDQMEGKDAETWLASLAVAGTEPA